MTSGEGAGRSSEEAMAAAVAMVERDSADVYVLVAISQDWAINATSKILD